MYPSSHYLVVGDAGSRKSTFAATFPKPAFVFQMDSHAKAMPYRRRGLQGETGQIITVEGMEDQGGIIPFELIMHPKHPEQVLFRIEHYQTAEISAGADYIYAYENFLARLGSLRKEVRAGKWKTVIFDSLSSLLFEARKLDEYKMNPSLDEGRKAHGLQSYGAAARAIEELMRSHLSSMPCNVVVLGHLKTERDKVGNIIEYLPEAPGSLPRQLPAVFPEAYVMLTDDKGECYLKTRKTDMYTATSQIPCPNPCQPTYRALWQDFAKEFENLED